MGINLNFLARKMESACEYMCARNIYDYEVAGHVIFEVGKIYQKENLLWWDIKIMKSRSFLKHAVWLVRRRAQDLGQNGLLGGDGLHRGVQDGLLSFQ